MSEMRAKMSISSVEPLTPVAEEGVVQETLTMNAVVSDEAFGENGESENNTYSRWTPTAELKMVITNPTLLGKFKVGEEYYVDFIKAEA